MDRSRNWIAWIALALAGLALVVALGGRFGGPRMAWGFQPSMYAQAPAAPAAPPAPDARFQRGHDGPPAFFSDRTEREGRFQGGPMMAHGRGFDRGHGFGPLAMLFGLLGGLTKLAALGLLAWLLLRVFQQRRNEPPAAAPTTPAGHDPRVE